MPDTAVGITPGAEAFLLRTVPGALAPLEFTPINGGRSNLTYRVGDAAGHRWVLRRPPLGEYAATAHDVLREARLMQGLAGQVPVAPVVATCDDPAVAGAPFVVLGFVDGMSLRSGADVLAQVPERDRARIGPSLIDELLRLHRADPEPLGLAGLTDRRDYLARQLRRWHANWESGRTRELPDLAAAHAALAERIPEQTAATIVHGDYRVDNCLLTDDLTVAAIVDWELATVGDPLADLAQFLVYWAEPGDAHRVLFDPPTAVPGFSTRTELTARYCTATGVDPARLDYYLAFNWWKIACIVEDVYSRMARGQMGASDRDPASFGEQAARLAAHARRLTSDLGRPETPASATGEEQQV